ncbi:MAG TPA: site-specific DNA-methyltransferase [Deinococcales bacterium]|nr:site-specific DNA-methyltransferase [Deinococcales bacterium]
MSQDRKPVGSYTHAEATRLNIPPAEMDAVLDEATRSPVPVTFERNRDLDPQFVWRGKDVQDWANLVVPAPPLYIQEKIHPQALIHDLVRRTAQGAQAAADQAGLFDTGFATLAAPGAETDYYHHDQHWSNRLILGDSLQVMASLAEREGLRGQVQCIYLDPPYGIKFNSNFQWSTTTRDVKDGNAAHITREPEQVKAFRDTWRDGIHSYLTYLRDRLTVARDLLTDSGSIFVQIGDENVHRVRAVMDEVFGEDNFVSQIAFRTTTGRGGNLLSGSLNYLLWFGKHIDSVKYRQLFYDKASGATTGVLYSVLKLSDGSWRRATEAEKSDLEKMVPGARLFRPDNLTSTRSAGEGDVSTFSYQGRVYNPGKRTFTTNAEGLGRLARAERVYPTSTGTIQYVRYLDDFPAIPYTNVWMDGGTGSFTDEEVYVVQTPAKIIERCLLMTTDPGDLVLDPTCGSGTTAFVAEQWGRRWITIDTSRVALALARGRLMGARYPYYLLADSPEGQAKDAEVSRRAPSTVQTFGRLRQGFVYDRVPHITLKSIANNAEIDVIWEKWQATLEPLRAQLNAALGQSWEEWQVPREPSAQWPEAVRALHRQWWEARLARQREIDASIASRAEFEFLYDRPFEDKKKVRVAGPFTVESVSPHRMLGVDENGDPFDPQAADPAAGAASFADVILEQLRSAGVQQADKAARISFEDLTPWPGGGLVSAEGHYRDDAGQRVRAGVFIGPEFGTVSRADLVSAAREAAEAGFGVLIACAFNFEAQATEFSQLGRVPVMKARMNADLHMGGDFKPTGKGNLFVVFGEPDIEVQDAGEGLLRVKIRGVDVFDPSKGEVRSDSTDGIACWFVDTDYDAESFFVRQAYFLGQNDPYTALKTTLRGEIDADAWASLQSDTSRPFPRPADGRIAVKVINHLGDEVLKVFRV